MEQSKKTIGKYELDKLLGKGQFGGVYLGLDTEDNNMTYAIKVIDKKKVNSSSLLKRLLKSEIAVMSKIKHPNVLHLYEFLESSNTYYAVTQLCNGGDMEEKLEKEGNFSEPKSVFFLKQIMSGFVELHSKKVMHRDFKLANLFLHEGNVIIGDFGFAKAGVDMATTKLGTPYNMAPEILFSKGEPYTSSADLWSIGVVFFQMLFGRLPFPARSLSELKNKVRSFNGAKLNIPSKPAISKTAKDLLMKLLEGDVNRRITWNQFFNHPIFVDINNSSYVPNFRSSVMKRASKFSGRNVNDDTSNPIEKAKKVNNQFEKDKIKASTTGNFLPRQDGRHELEMNSSKAGVEKPSFKIIDNYMKNERQKHLFLFEGARKAKNLSISPEFQEQAPLFLTACLCLAKKTLMILKNNLNIIQSKINLYSLKDFEEFCDSKSGKLLLETYQKDLKNFKVFYQKVDTDISKGAALGQEFDTKIIGSIRSDSSRINTIDYCLEQVLISCYHFYRSASWPREELMASSRSNQRNNLFDTSQNSIFNLSSESTKGNIRREYLIYMIYCHDGINIDRNFLANKEGFFDWDVYFKKLQFQSDNELEMNLLVYQGKKSKISKLFSHNRLFFRLGWVFQFRRNWYKVL